MSTFNHLDAFYYKQFVNKESMILQRINECDERKKTNFINNLLLNCNYFTDHTVLVGSWLKDLKIMHYDLYRIKETKELKHLGIFSEELDAVKIVEWPDLIKTPLQDKLEVYLRYGEKENEREIEFKGQGKWENFKNEI